MCKALRTYMSIILIITMLFTAMPMYAFGAEIPSGYKESTKAGSKISTDVYLTTHEKPDTGDSEDSDNNIVYTVETYLQNLEDNDYTQDVDSTKQLNGKKNDVVTITKENAPKIAGFTFNKNIGITSGQLTSEKDLVLKLYYDRNLITLSIDPDNEAGSKDEKIIKYGSMLETPTHQKDKEGYKFNGWVDSDGNPIDFTKPFLKDTIIKPVWMPDSSSGEGDNPSKPGEGDNPSKPDDTSKEYQYIVNYWYDGELEQVKGSGKLGDLTPYDLITPTEHNGHNYVLESFQITKFITDNPDKNISEIYYTLDVKDRNGNDASEGDGIPDKYQTSSDKYTQADTFGYQINYNYKDAAAMVEQVTEKGKGTVGAVIPYSYASTVTKNEQTFKLENLVVNSNIITPNESNNTVEVNYTLLKDGQNAPSEPIVYMVSVDPDNGTKIYTYFVNKGETVPALDTPEKAGYEFAGWVDSKGKPFDLGTPINSNTAIKAAWKLKDNSAEYKVSHYTPTSQVSDSQEFKGFELVTTDVYAGEIGSQVQAFVKNWPDYKVDKDNANAVMSGIVGDKDKMLELKVFYRYNSVKITLDNEDGNKQEIEVNYGDIIDQPKPGIEKPGYKFDGWVDENGNKIDFTKPIDKDMVLKPSWIANSSGGSGSGSSGGGGGGGRPGKPVKPNGNKPADQPSTSKGDHSGILEVLVQLDNVNHIAYIHGYEDGTMRPNNSITRGEVAEIVYRLMTEDYRNKHYTLENSFSDVTGDVWCNASISTDAKAGILLGYEDGEFKYNSSITRAEFATIVSRFFTNYSDVKSDFVDIEGHWAEKYINNAASAGWITGYDDKTFRPDNYISRAEAVTIINRILNRNVKEDGLVDGIKEWPDVNKASWYYLAIQEAANAHNYSTSNGAEYWESIIE